MPLIQVTLYETRLDEETVSQLIEKLTDAACSVVGEQMRELTWCIVDGVPARQWGIGGKAG
jgi:4-oxalocrotonate tautomerase